ncbi:MAG: hypothetical protein K2O69_04240 [Odoribacter sp.]|nr:hypothetical protein [Odoribacter sp.]
MDYRFEISNPKNSDFRCEIAISGDQTFQQFHDKIVEVLNFDTSQMASFFAIDKLGNRGREIALMEMTSGENDENCTLVMDVTPIHEIVNAHCLELEYVYDFFADNYLKVEYVGEYRGDSAVILPLCVYCEGELPRQTEYDVEKDWAFDRDDDDYDDSFMEEFGGGGRCGRGDDDDYRFDDDEDDDGYGGGYSDDIGFDDRYESLDDYIDKL